MMESAETPILPVLTRSHVERVAHIMGPQSGAARSLAAAETMEDPEFLQGPHCIVLRDRALLRRLTAARKAEQT